MCGPLYLCCWAWLFLFLNHSSTWSLKEGSTLPIHPGSAVRQDLNITRADIKAGKAVLHLVDLT